MHTTIVVGNLGNDPELKHLESGRTVCEFSVAVNETWKDGNGVKHTKTYWYECHVWGKRADVAAQYLKKGQPVTLRGRVEARAYINREGEAVGVLDLTVNQFDFISTGQRTEGGSPQRSTGNGTSAPAAQQEPASTDVTGDEGEGADDDLPF